MKVILFKKRRLLLPGKKGCLRKPFSLSLLVFLLSMGRAEAQMVTAEALKKFAGWSRFTQISRFYQLTGEKPAWIGYTYRQNEFLALRKLAASIGLNEADYQAVFFSSYQPGSSLTTATDSVEAEVRFTDAAIHLFSEVKGGNKVPSFGYAGLKYSPDLSDVVPAIQKHLEANSLKDLFNFLQPRSKEYAMALSMFDWCRQMINQPGFRDARVTSTVADSTNQPLLARLYQLGFTSHVNSTLSKKEWQALIKAAQSAFGLAEDGIPGPATLRVLNVSLHQRTEELKLALNTLRWLEDIKQRGNVLILNLPSASFLVYENGRIVLDSKVIAGKPATPTPTLTSTITEVILYPYWNVTYNIATKELLPHIKRDIGYLERNNYQVLNGAGKVLDPYSINWQALSRTNFPYFIRQSTGCDNSLGLVKFNFYNPFTVYLHDTPVKKLFGSEKRFYSHGCMRVEKPVELARYLLGFNRLAIDTLTVKGCLTNQAPKTIRIEKPLPLLVLYSTVWYDREGNIRFYEDVYKKLDGMLPQRVAVRKEEASLPGTAY